MTMQDDDMQTVTVASDLPTLPGINGMGRVARDSDGTLPAFAWPGGYPMRYYTADGATICPKCANDPNTSDPVVAGEVYWEGPTEVCEDGSRCGAMVDGTWHAGTIESAYGDPDEVTA